MIVPGTASLYSILRGALFRVKSGRDFAKEYILISFIIQTKLVQENSDKISILQNMISAKLD